MSCLYKCINIIYVSVSIGEEYVKIDKANERRTMRVREGMGSNPNYILKK